MDTPRKPEQSRPRREASRYRLPDTRRSIVHKFSVAGHKGYLRCSVYEDGALGEVFIELSKSGSFVSGITDAFATLLSISLQSGVKLEAIADKFIGARFEPDGVTTNPDIPSATSIIDYIFRYLVLRFGEEARKKAQ